MATCYSSLTDVVTAKSGGLSNCFFSFDTG